MVHPACKKCPFLDPADLSSCNCLVVDRLLENPPRDMEELESILDFWGIPKDCPRLACLRREDGE